MSSKQAFVLRIKPGSVDKMKTALSDKQLLIGWANAQGLLDESLSWVEFREIVHRGYHQQDTNYRASGASAGHMWRFIRDMQIDDLVVVPYQQHFYVAQVKSTAMYCKDKIVDDSAYRRDVIWLNNGNPIPRVAAVSPLISRMKAYGTCTNASDLVTQIEDCVENAKEGKLVDLRTSLIADVQDKVLHALQKGHIDERRFESLLERLMLKLGASGTKLIGRRQDKGVDIVADFIVAGVIPFRVAIQAKHWLAHAPIGVDVLKHFIGGMQHEEAQLGLIITTGVIDDKTREEALEYQNRDDNGYPMKIEFIDGEQLAAMLLDQGLSVL